MNILFWKFFWIKILDLEQNAAYNLVYLKELVTTTPMQKECQNDKYI